MKILAMGGGEFVASHLANRFITDGHRLDVLEVCLPPLEWDVETRTARRNADVALAQGEMHERVLE